jgi:hypothetical protein
MRMVFTALALLGRSTLLAVVAAATVELSRKGASEKGEGGEGDSAHSLTRPLAMPMEIGVRRRTEGWKAAGSDDLWP